MWIILPQKGKSFLDCALSMKFTYYLMLINHETKKNQTKTSRFKMTIINGRTAKPGLGLAQWGFSLDLTVSFSPAG